MQITWCKVEGRVDNISDISILTPDQCPGGRLPREPTLVVMALDIKSHLNSNAGKNEIVIASGIVHTNGTITLCWLILNCGLIGMALSDHGWFYGQP